MTHLFLIEIGGSSVNHPVPGLQGVGHDTFRFIHGNLEDAETDGRHHRTPQPLAESGDEALATRLRQMRLRHGAAPAGLGTYRQAELLVLFLFQQVRIQAFRHFPQCLQGVIKPSTLK